MQNFDENNFFGTPSKQALILTSYKKQTYIKGSLQMNYNWSCLFVAIWVV